MVSCQLNEQGGFLVFSSVPTCSWPFRFKAWSIWAQSSTFTTQLTGAGLHRNETVHRSIRKTYRVHWLMSHAPNNTYTASLPRTSNHTRDMLSRMCKYYGIMTFNRCACLNVDLSRDLLTVVCRFFCQSGNHRARVSKSVRCLYQLQLWSRFLLRFLSTSRRSF